MIKRFSVGTIILGLAGLTNLSADPLTLNFASGTGSLISFDGSGDFGFTTTGTSDFTIQSQTNAPGTVGDTGNIGPNSNDVFEIGPIVGGIEAEVTGSSGFSLTDGTGTLAGTVTFGNIDQVGSGGGLNTFTTSVNLTGLTYSGTNAALTQLASSGGILTVGYSFGSAMTLAGLTTSPATVSYGGTITTATPEPLLSGLGLFGIGGLLITIRRRFQVSKV